jgi:2,3-bisphosphoglycerate-dependent phosphoglycerate mutase
MKKIVLLRHGESLWNKENRFTGWTDVDLSDKGIKEAYEAGNLLNEAGISFQIAYVSYLKRAVKTLNCVLDRMNEDWIPIFKSWRLNEKHYGALQGLNKSETAARYGNEQVHIWRRSYDVAPMPLKDSDPESPINDVRYSHVPLCDLPRTESLKDAIMRVIPYWNAKYFLV